MYVMRPRSPSQCCELRARCDLGVRACARNVRHASPVPQSKGLEDKAGFQSIGFEGEAGFQSIVFEDAAGFQSMVFKDKAGFQSMVFKDSICGMPGFGHVAHAHVNPPGLTDVVPWSSSANMSSASSSGAGVCTACAHLQEKIQTLEAKVESLMLAQYIS